MAAVKELLRAENDGSLSFGDYTLSEKTKKDNYEFEGDIYKVKTFSELTKLERNGLFVYESVPGRAFSVSAKGDVQFTLELEPECEYEVFIDGESAGKMRTNLSGKLSVSVELSEGQEATMRVVKC